MPASVSQNFKKIIGVIYCLIFCIDIGYETALDLAKRGCKVYIACREAVPLERQPEETVCKSLEHIFHNTLIDSFRNFIL